VKNALFSYLLTAFIAIAAVACLATALAPAKGAISDAFVLITRIFAQLG
jgi:hypothetical protein